MKMINLVTTFSLQTDIGNVYCQTVSIGINVPCTHTVKIYFSRERSLKINFIVLKIIYA